MRPSKGGKKKRGGNDGFRKCCLVKKEKENLGTSSKVAVITPKVPGERRKKGFFLRWEGGCQ